MKRISVICVFVLVFGIGLCGADIVKLFDEEDSFPGMLNQSSQGSFVGFETKDVFCGKKALKVTPYQSFSENIKGWGYHIADKPGKGEFRYIVFAWKKLGGNGIMAQIADNGQWGYAGEPLVVPGVPCRRYVAGENVPGWSAIRLSDKIPGKWTLVIRDLYEDFGEFTMTGIALTPFNGDGGLWDCIYLGTDKKELKELAGKLQNK